MGRYTGKTCRLLTMLGLTASFFVVEITVGYIANSIALVADSFHMLSDVVALVVGFASVRISKWHTQKNTFGWQRAEVLGALVNTVFLIALCFTIIVESLQRFIEMEPVREPKLLLIVGAVGLLVNLIGLALFHRHGHSHGGGGGHGHSHGGGGGGGGGGHGHSHGGHKDKLLPKVDSPDSVKSPPQLCNGETGSIVIQVPDNTATSKPGSPDDELPDVETRGKPFGFLKKFSKSKKEEPKHEEVKFLEKEESASSQLNMRGVFLHVLGDALGSVIVIISALVIWLVDGDWKYYIDPGLSMVMVFIMLASAIPLLKETSLILLQTVPTHIQVKEIQDRLVQNVDGVLAVHEFHVWRLAGDRIIASAHIRCRNLGEYMRIAEQVKEFFHDEGIHSTTIQPEFEDLTEPKEGRHCALECGPDKNCYPNTCCASNKKKVDDGNSSNKEGTSSSPSHVYTNRFSTLSDPEEHAGQQRADADGKTSSHRNSAPELEPHGPPGYTESPAAAPRPRTELVYQATPKLTAPPLATVKSIAHAPENRAHMSPGVTMRAPTPSRTSAAASRRTKSSSSTAADDETNPEKVLLSTPSVETSI
ncbi:uncharacterized protein LOC141913186 isoform X2 [Tubulanus polymorphus]|uniref:uncharacterized protein LOC141913186 isoform X2 n=1 Tax=Tubulanus polymorphus TaxID=672921 RepID=UPI003DA21B48